MANNLNNMTLDEHREAFKRRRFLAMPLAGSIMWTLSGIAGAYLPQEMAMLTMYILIGSILYLGLFISKFTGENLIGGNKDKSAPKNPFDRLFFYCVISALLVFSIAIPFANIDSSSLPLSLGILTGLMWVGFSWIIENNVGIIHSVVRTVLILIVWHLFPEQRFVLIPAVVVLVYLYTMFVLELRWRKINVGSIPVNTMA